MGKVPAPSACGHVREHGHDECIEKSNDTVEAEQMNVCSCTDVNFLTLFKTTLALHLHILIANCLVHLVKKSAIFFHPS